MHLLSVVYLSCLDLYRERGLTLVIASASVDSPIKASATLLFLSLLLKYPTGFLLVRLLIYEIIAQQVRRNDTWPKKQISAAVKGVVCTDISSPSHSSNSASSGYSSSPHHDSDFGPSIPLRTISLEQSNKAPQSHRQYSPQRS
jgi:hypothetical protein